MQSNEWLKWAEQSLDYGVIGLLVLMSIISLWLFIERLMFYSTVKLEEYENKDHLELDLSNNLSTIATMGSNAPYVGLLGTVLGIMITFYTLGDMETIDAKVIMVGLALALKATAMGLVVAIPSIVFYNVLLRKMEKLSTLWDIHYKS
ncbi:MAG: TonB-system energizer ExbB [Campylobacterota bacterium]|nr:TonB-system energizer ExbB [Campylobacterota bacterium]